jgi:putative oxidoreductase
VNGDYFKTLIKMKIFSTSISVFYANVYLLATRLIVSGFMLSHGLPKLAQLILGGQIKFEDPFGLGPVISLALVVFAEAVCSLFVILGLGTRLAVVPLIIDMLVTIVQTQANAPFDTKEKPLLFLLMFLMLLVFGSGKYSIDRFIGNNPGYLKNSSQDLSPADPLP